MIVNQKSFCKWSIAATLLVLIVGIISYSNTFEVPYALDDESSITHNDVIANLDNFYANRVGYEFLPNRYVAYLTFALNYHFGGLDVTGYHVVNLIIHLLTSLLVYALLRLTFKTPYFQIQIKRKSDSVETCFPTPQYQPESRPLPSTFSSPHEGIKQILHPSSFIPLFAALLFVVHPIQTQAVTNVVQRVTSLSTMFYLLSVFLYVRGRLSIDKSGSNSQSSGGDSCSFFTSSLSLGAVLFFGGSVISAIVAMKTKEIAFTLPLAVALYELFFFSGPWRHRIFYLLPLLATLPIIPLTIIDFGGPPSDIVADTGGQLRVGTGVSRLDYLFTQFRVIVTYLRLLFLPVSQNLDYDYPIYTSFFSLPVLLSFLLLVFIFAAAVYLFWRTRWVRINQIEIQVENRTDLVEGQGDTGSSQSAFQSQSLIRLVAFGIFWFFLTLSVESTFIPIVDVVMEHRLYLPNFGAAAGFAVAFHLMARKFPRLAGGKLFFVGATILVLVLGFATYQRNHIWGDSLRLWQDVVTKSPNKGRALNNLGVALDDAGKRQDAYNLFTQAIAVDPNYYKSYYNLADLYLVSGQPDEALPLLQTAIRINPNFREAYVSIGAALMRAGKYREVTTFLEKNLKYVYENAEAYFYIGASYAFIGNRQEAMKLLSIISQIDPSYAASLAGLLGVKSNPSSATRSH